MSKKIDTEKNVSDILDSDLTGTGVAGKNIEAVIWTHRHFDHVGDPSTFPSTVDLVVGPGFKKQYRPGYLINAEASVLDSDAKDHHAVGHLCGLARVTGSPDFFVLMGADACHHIGLLRPTEYLPLPSTILPSPIEKFGSGGCPGPLLQQLQPNKSATEPFFTPSKVTFPVCDAAQDTIRKFEELDAAGNIFVIIAHDESLRAQIDLYPKTINN